jgi:N-acetyl-S-(2-succino)cysteine monooxygenase
VREALNFGTAAMAHDERYVRAREFAEVVLALWDSWADDAFIMDKESSHFFDPAKVQSLDHTGKYFTCAGPMCVARSPQGRPVMVQAGGSEPGKELAAETAEMVYTVQSDFETGREFYADLKGRMAKFGREPHELKVMPGVYTIVGRSEQEAEDIYGELRELVDEEVAKATLGLCLGGADLSLLPFDGPVPTGLSTNAGTTHLKTMIKIAQDRNLSLRELAMDVAAGGYGHWTVRGTPKQIADQLEERFRGGAADGFNLMPATLPGGLEDFIDLVLPELRRRGLFRTEYDGSTLRDHLGLKHPARRIAKPLSSPARAVA